MKEIRVEEVKPMKWGELTMETLPLPEVKKRLSYLVDKLNATGEDIVITQNGRPIAMLAGLDNFESRKETIAIQSDSEFMEEIRKGLHSLKAGSKLYTLEELLGE
jgi:prevent-host-death family protein